MCKAPISQSCMSREVPCKSCSCILGINRNPYPLKWKIYPTHRIAIHKLHASAWHPQLQAITTFQTHLSHVMGLVCPLHTKGLIFSPQTTAVCYLSSLNQLSFLVALLGSQATNHWLYDTQYKLVQPCGSYGYNCDGFLALLKLRCHW